MTNKKPNRKRNRVVTIRMNENEYAEFQRKLDESGLTQQAYVITAVRGATITPSTQLDVLKEISKTFADLDQQLRGLATNVNQMAHVANGQGFLPTANTLSNLHSKISGYKKESDQLWQSIRSLIDQLKVRPQ